jgi:uroporphyrinogen-III synthase
MGQAPSGPVLLVRAAGGEDGDAEALRALGCDVVEDPYLVVAPCTDSAAGERAARVLEAVRNDADLLLLTSRSAVRALDALVGRDALVAAVAAGVARGLRGAAVGPTTAALLRELGLDDVLEPEVATSRGLLAALRERTARERADAGRSAGGRPGRAGQAGRAVLPCGAQAMKGLGAGLVADGWGVEEVVVYVTEDVPGAPRSVADLRAGSIAALVLRSPTAVRAVARHVPVLPGGTVAVCGGPTTAAEVTAVWGVAPVVSVGPTAAEVARTVAAVLAGDADAAGTASGAGPASGAGTTDAADAADAGGSER